MPKGKAEADRWFSKYIRLRDCLRTTGTTEFCVCCTCGATVRDDGESLDAGHYQKRNIIALRYCEQNVHGQCRRCNFYGKGEVAAHRMHIVKLHGEKTAERLDQIAMLEKAEPWKFKKAGVEYQAIARDYKTRFDILQNQGTL